MDFVLKGTIITFSILLKHYKRPVSHQSSILQEWNESSLQSLKFLWKIDIWVADVAILGWSPDLSELAKLWGAWDTRVWHSCKQQSLKIICYHPGSTGISFWLINLNFPILAFNLKRVFIVDCSWFLLWEPGQLRVCNRIWNWKQIKAPSINTFFHSILYKDTLKTT